jgi:hypothetical protein
VTSAPPSTMSATAVIAAPPTLVDLSKPPVPEPIPPSGPGSGHKSGWGKKVKPPSMVLDDDINGFRGNTKRKGGGGGKKNKKVRITTPHSPSQPIFSSRIRMYNNWPCGILPNHTIQAARTTTTNTRFGNIGSMKKGWSVSPRSAVWKHKSASDAVALEVTTLKVIQTMPGLEKQVLYSMMSPFRREPHFLF